MSKYAHVVKKAGHLINDGLIERIIKNHRHSFGIAIAKDDKLQVICQQAAPDAGVLKQVQEEFKDSCAIFTFGDVANILPEDVQPYVILKNDEGDDICVVCLDGDFDRHRKSNESHIAEYLVAKGNIEKRLKRLLEGAQSYGDVIEKLNDDLTKEDISNLWSSRGTVTFLFADGQTCTISGGNENKGEFEWGFASNTYGEKQTTEVTEKKEASALDKLKSLVTGSKPQDTVPKNGTAVSNGMTTSVPQTAVQEPLPPGTVLVKPDFSNPSLDTRKKQKSWYEDRLGYEPQQYKNAPPLLRIPSADGQYTWKMADTKNFELLKHTMMSYPPKDTASPLAQKEPPLETKTVEQPKVEPQPEPQPQQVEASDDLPPWLKKAKKPSSVVKEVPPQQSKTATVLPSKTAQVALPAGGNDQAKEKVPASVSTARMPVISPDQKQRVQEIMKKTELVGQFSEGMKRIIDPKDIRKQIENEIPDFAKSFGLGADMSVFDTWTYEQFFNFSQAVMEIGKPDVYAKMLFDFRNYGLKQKLASLINPNFKNGRQAG